MTKTQHTSGPWELSEGNTSIWAISPLNARFRVAQITHPSPMNGIDGNANAFLIAAAPELLEALEDAASILEYAEVNMVDCPHRRAWSKARSVIAKAKGDNLCGLL